jgi:hypothetical protein
MINMQELDLYNNNKITYEGIKGMINMQKLNLCSNEKITDNCIK